VIQSEQTRILRRFSQKSKSNQIKSEKGGINTNTVSCVTQMRTLRLTSELISMRKNSGANDSLTRTLVASLGRNCQFVGINSQFLARIYSLVEFFFRLGNTFSKIFQIQNGWAPEGPFVQRRIRGS
jgi:hypothetical protein